MDTSGVKVLETAEDIQDRRQQVLDRYRRFKELSVMRRQKLEDSYRFQCFRRDAEELEKWIQEKLQIASDENYKDPSNLQVGVSRRPRCCSAPPPPHAWPRCPTGQAAEAPGLRSGGPGQRRDHHQAG